MLENAELSVQFDDLQPLARFDYVESDLDKLADEAVRFRRVMDELGPRGSHVKEVDLAFNRLAVVKPIDFKGEERPIVK